MFDYPAEDRVIAQAFPEQPEGLSTSVVDPRHVSPASMPPQYNPVQLNHPEMQCTDSATGSPSLTAHDKARGTHIVDGSGQRCANASSSGHNVPARTPTSSTSVVSPQSGRRGETKESPKGAASAVNARASSHAVRPDVSLHSKVLKVSGRGEDPETAPSRSSVIRPALPAPSSSKAKTARGKRAAVPEAKSVPARKTGKQKRELLTPLEYAQRLHDKMADAAPTNKSRAKPYLRGMRILYYGGDRTYASEETTGHMDHVGRSNSVAAAGRWDADPAYFRRSSSTVAC